jgi:hypothetical protein
MLQYFDGVREVRTGIMRMGAGLQSDSINKLNSTATGANLMASTAQGRQELIARTFAETGLRDLMLLIHELIRKNNTKPQIVRLRNKWVPIDPREWKSRYDMTISVGLGTGNREQQISNIMMMGQFQERAFPTGIIKPENILFTGKKLAEAAGYKNPDAFFTDPTQQPPKPPMPDPKMLEAQGKMQIEQAKMQSDNQKSQAEMHLSAMVAQHQAQMDQAKLELEAEKMKFQMEMEQFKVMQQAELEREKMQWQMQMEANKQGFARETEFMKQGDLMQPLKNALAQIEQRMMGMQVVSIEPIKDEMGNVTGGVRVMADGSKQEIMLQ